MSYPSLAADTSPTELLGRIQDLFRELGLFEQRLALTHEGQKYLSSCNGAAFTVYRLNENSHVPPGIPGWPVCLVTAEAVIDETSPPFLAEDEFASGLTLQDWLRLIEETFRK